MSGNSQHYISNLRVLEFNLFEALDIAKTSLGQGPYKAMDESSARDVLKGLCALAVGELATAFAETDRTPLTLDAQGNVALPAALTRRIKSSSAGDWHRLDLPEHIGGLGAPPSVRWAGFEMVAG